MSSRTWHHQGITDTRDELNTNRNDRDVSEKLKSCEHKYLEAKKWIAALKRENVGLKKQLSEYGNSALDSTGMMGEMRENLKKKQTQMHAYKAMITQLQGELKSATASFTKMEVQKLETKQKYQNEMKDIIESNKQLKEDLENAKVENSDITDLEQEMDDLLEEMDKKDDTIANLNQIIKELEVDQDKLQRELEDYKVKAQSGGKDIEQKKSDESEKIELLTKSLDDKELLIQSLNDKCATLKESGARLEKTLKSKSKLLKEKGHQQAHGGFIEVEELKREIASLKEENIRLSQSGNVSYSKMSNYALDVLMKTQQDAMLSLRSVQTHMENQMQNIIHVRDTNHPDPANDDSRHDQNMIKPAHSTLTDESSVDSPPKQMNKNPRKLLSPQWTMEHNDLFFHGNEKNTLRSQKNLERNEKKTEIINEGLNDNPSGITLSTAPSTESELTEYTMSPKGSNSVWTEEESVPHTIPEERDERQANLNHSAVSDYQHLERTEAPPTLEVSQNLDNRFLEQDDYTKAQEEQDPLPVVAAPLKNNQSPVKSKNKTLNKRKKKMNYLTKTANSFARVSSDSDTNSISTGFSSNSGRRAAKMKKNIRVLFKKPKKDTKKRYARSDMDISFDTKGSEWETF